MEGILTYNFMLRALLAAVMAGLLCSTLSFFVVLNRLSFMGAGISHSMFGGLALGVLLGINPLYTGGFFAILVALLIGYISRYGKIQEDTVIGIFFSSGMAIGVILISFQKGYYPELFSLLFGNVLTVSLPDLYFLGLIMIFVLSFVFIFFKELFAISFDEELAQANGIPVIFFHLALLTSLALTVIASVLVVGIVLASALLVIPAAAGYRFSRNYRGMLFCSITVGVVSGLAGLVSTFYYDIPSGAAIVLCAAALFFISLFFRWWEDALRSSHVKKDYEDKNI